MAKLENHIPSAVPPPEAAVLARLDPGWVVPNES